MLAFLLPLAASVLGLWLLLSAAMAWGARRAQALAARGPRPCFTAPPTAGPDAAETHLVFLGDVQRGIADVAGPLAEHLRTSGADLLISSGDLVSHGEGPYYGIVLAALERARLETPTRVVPGNHDLWPRRSKDDRIGGALFEAAIGPRHWAVRSGPVLIVGLDNGAEWLIETQVAWLEATLEANAGIPWILVCHRPMWRFERDEVEVVHDMEPLRPVFAARPPALVVSGHLHQYHDEVRDGVRHIVNAHGGDVHGLAITRGDFEVLHVHATAEGITATPQPLTRSRDVASYVDQLAVRFWSDRRKAWGAMLAWPGRLVLRLFGADVPVVRHPIERRPPARDVLMARRREPVATP